MPEQPISPSFPFTLQSVPVLDSFMTYVDTGTPSPSRPCQPTALFLHGNPTSSYLWRNIIPHISPTLRCIAPDLIGMGSSGKPTSHKYRFTDHYQYLSAFIDTILPEQKLILVVHDWGSALGLHWSSQHPDRVAGLVLMEFIYPIPSFDAIPSPTKEIFQDYRHADQSISRRILIEENDFIEKRLPSGVVRELTKEEMDHYRAPFLRMEDREPVWRWPNEIPIAGQPEDVWDIAQKYHTWLLNSEVKKLVLYVEPGAFITEKMAGFYRENLRNVVVRRVGEGRHYLQEDCPDEIGWEIGQWLAGVVF